MKCRFNLCSGSLFCLVLLTASRLPAQAISPASPVSLPKQGVIRPVASQNDAEPSVVAQDTEASKQPTVPKKDIPLLPEVEIIAPRDSASQNTPTPSPSDFPSPAPSNPAPSTAPDPGVPLPAQFSPDAAASPSANAGQNLSNLRPNQAFSETLTPRLSSQIGSSLTVIGREAIRNSGQSQLSEVLRQAPGLDVVQSGGAGQQTSIFLRGANANQVKVLIDGVPANDPVSPGRAFDFSTLTTDQVERVEILRGPQSTVYGSDAIGGVINIVTSPGGTPGTRIGAIGGRYGTGRLYGSRSGGDETFQYNVGGSVFETNGFSAARIPPGNQEADGYRNQTASGRFGLVLTENTKLDLSVRHNHSETEIDAFDFVPPFGFIPQDSNDLLVQKNTYSRLQATSNWLDGHWVSRVGGGYSQIDRLSLSAFGGEFYGRTGKFDWQNDVTLLDVSQFKSHVIAGYDYYEEIGRSAGVPRGRQDDQAFYAQMTFDVWDRWHTSAGTRHDEYSIAGPADTWRTTSRWDFKETDSALHGAIGTGFRAPALEELFNLPFGGNPLLRPERSRGWEAGWQQGLADGLIVVDATYFRNDFNDLITFVFDPNLPFFGRLDNVNRALATGVEVSTLWRWTEQTNTYVNYTRTDTRDRDSGLPLPRRPRDKWQTGLSWTEKSKRLNFNASANFIGDRVDFGGINLDSYMLINVAGWYQASDCWRWLGRIDNLTNEKYDEIFGYQNPGASLFVGAEFTN